MKYLFYRLRRNFWLFLAVFGPATITAIADNDGAGVATFSLSGAKFGYAPLFVLMFAMILLAVTQEMGARIAIVTGKGLGDHIRERYGIRTAVFVFLGLVIANLGSIVANFSAVKVTSEIFHLPTLPALLAIIAFAVLIVAKGSYHTNQNLFFAGILLYFSYVFSAIKSQPDWNEVFVSTVVPAISVWNKEFLLSSIAIIGTTITPWGQFFINSYLNDKKVPVEKLKFSQLETYFGSLITIFFSAMMIVATASTLHKFNIPLETGEQAALAIEPFAGHFASVFFGIGLLNAGIMGIIIISLSTAYAFSEFFGYEGSLDSPFERGKLFYGLFTLQLVIAFLIVMIPSISLFKIVFYTQSLNSILLPVIFFFLLKITNSKQIMGTHVNSSWYNYFSIIATTLIIIAGIVTVIGLFF